jgi:hypothetical protein
MQIKPNIILLCSSFLVFILGLCCIDSGHNWSDDFALYLSQTQALLEGNTTDLLRANYFAMEHSYAHVGPYLYPSGFPILLLPIYALFGLNFWALKVYCLLFFVASLPLIYRISKQLNCSTNQALSITLLVAFNYHFIRFSDHVLSDLPFLFFSLFSYYQIQKANLKNPIKAVLLGLLIFFSYNIRDIGITLLPCLFIYQWQAYKKDKKPSFFMLLLPYFAFISLWIIRWYSSPSAPSKQLSLLSETSLEIILNNAYYYSLLIGNYFLIFKGIPLGIQWLVSGVFVSLLLFGMYKKGREQPALFIYFSATIGIYFIWISFQGMRFLFSILPFLVYFIIEGIKALPISFNVRRFLVLGLILTSLVQSLFISYYYWNTDTNEAYSSEMQQIYQYIQAKTPKDALIVFHKPRALRLFTNRNSVQKNLSAAHFALVKQPYEVPPSDSILLQTAHYTFLLSARKSK